MTPKIPCPFCSTQRLWNRDPELFMVLVTILFLFSLIGFGFWMEFIEASEKSFPKFSIEAITASNISILPWPESSLSAQDFTINFVVENRYNGEIEYKNMEASISYHGHSFWLNTLGLHRQQKEERTSIQVIFGNFPVKIMDDYVEFSITKENRTSGFGTFTVEVKGNYKSGYMKVSCGEVKLQFSSLIQEIGLLQNCSTSMCTVLILLIFLEGILRF